MVMTNWLLYFIEKFKFSNSEEHFIIAPEGLSKFYSRNMTGRVGACWMTKEDRENEIEDYLAYLDEVIENLVDKSFDLNNIVFNVFGFSQGCATASRWAKHTHLKVDNLVLYGGGLAHELLSENFFDDTSVFLLIGDEDPFVNRTQKDKLLKELENLEINHQSITYTGGHKVLTEVLENLVIKLNQ